MVELVVKIPREKLEECIRKGSKSITISLNAITKNNTSNVYDVVDSFGISRSFKGYNYLIKLLELAKKENNVPIMKLYKKVAEIYSDSGASASTVERCVRYCVKQCNKNSYLYQTKLSNISPEPEKLSVSKFIYTVCHLI